MGHAASELPVSVIVSGSFARGEADEESDIDTVLVRPAHVDESHEAWSASVEQWRSQIHRISGNPAEVLEIGPPEIGARLSSRAPVWRDGRREGIVVQGLAIDELTDGRNA